MSELQEHFAETYRSRAESDEAEEMEPCSASVAAALDVRDSIHPPEMHWLLSPSCSLSPDAQLAGQTGSLRPA